jgi:hypothetical protein
MFSLQLIFIYKPYVSTKKRTDQIGTDNCTWIHNHSVHEAINEIITVTIRYFTENEVYS